MTPPKRNQDIIEALILEVQSHPSLWDKKSKDYKDITVKSNSWIEIFNNLTSSFSPEELSTEKFTSPEEVKKRWQNLRTTFGRTKKKAKGKSGAGNSEDNNNFYFYIILHER